MLAGALIFCAIAGAPPPGLQAVLAPLRTHKTVQARMTQTKHSRAFKKPQVATGRLIVAGERQLRWEYTSPFKSALVRRDDKVSMTYPELGRKTAYDLSRDPSMKRVIDTILFFINADAARIDERFTVIAFEQGPIARLALKPRAVGVQAMIAHVEIRVNTTAGVLVEVSYVEPDGDRTRIQFADIRVDEPVEDALLQL